MRPRHLLGTIPHLAILFLLFGCVQPAKKETTALPAVHERALARTPTAPTEGTLRVASFNIQNFGPTKLHKKQVMTTLAQIMLQFDIIAIQEVSDVKLKVIPGLLDRIAAQGGVYKGLISPRTGRQPDDKPSQEQYAFVYNTKTVAALDDGALYDDASDLFQREPFVAHFRSVLGTFSFVLITVHTQPEKAVAEIAALHNVNQWARHKYPTEDDFITLGDFNGSCTYAKPEQLDALKIRGDAYVWVVPDDADTNLSPTHSCAYDRIVLTKTLHEFTGRWGVLRAFSDPAVSDHWPIWAEFQRLEQN